MKANTEGSSSIEGRRDKAQGQLPVPVWIVLAVILVGVYLVATPNAPVDLRADRLTALAAWNGLDPYVPVVELAERFGSDLRWTWIHPRTPAALVAQLPLAVFAESSLRLIAVVGGVTAVLATAGLAINAMGLGRRAALVLAGLAGLVTITVEAVTVGSQSALVGLLVALAWVRTRSHDDWVGGLGLGLAICLKVFPWLLIAMLALQAKWKAAAAAVGFAGLLNVAGLMFPGVTVGGALDALRSANVSASLDLNASVTRVLAESGDFASLSVVLAIVGLVATIFISRMPWSFDRQWFATLAVALGVSPLIWSHYAIVLIPALIWVGSRGGFAPLAAGVLWVGLVVPFPIFTAWVVVPILIVGTLLLAAYPGGGLESRQALSSGAGMDE